MLLAGRDLGSPTYFPGIEINRAADGALKLCQRRSILELGKAFNMVPGNMRTAATPLPLGTVITVEGEKYEPIKVYMSLIGSLIYYAIGTRPDVAYVVSKLARHMSAPTIAQEARALRAALPRLDRLARPRLPVRPDDAARLL